MIYKKITGCEIVDDYFLKVLNKKIVACKEQIALAKLVKKTFEKEKLKVDEELLNRYLKLQRYFEFKLFDWEITLFALQWCVFKKDGSPRWPEVVLLSGRGTGKNGFLDFTAFAATTSIVGIKEYNVDIFATSQDQAQTSFNDIYNMLEDNSKKMEKTYTWTKTLIKNLKTKSEIKYNTASYKTKDGGRPCLLVFDEYHAYLNYKLITVAKTGLGKKPHPRILILTTDGEVRGGPLDDIKTIANDVLFKDADDVGSLYFICKIDTLEDVKNEANWHKANPSLRFFNDLLDTMRREYKAYLINPQGNRAFIIKRMNFVLSLDEADVTSWENILACNKELPDLKGKPCVFSIDYAKTTDFVSAGILFKINDFYYWITKTWICKASKDLERIKAPLDEWELQGLLEYVEGPEIAPEVPVEWLIEQAQIYDIGVGGIDNFRITLLRKALELGGFEINSQGQKNKSKNHVYLNKRVTVMRTMPVIESAFNSQKLIWGINPLMNWYTNNTYVSPASGGNYVYEKKEEKSRKTDGFFALVNAFCVIEHLTETAKINFNDIIEITI